MNRRNFCKKLGVSVIASVVSPAATASALTAAGATGRRCRITVLRLMCNEDLQSRYLDDPEAGPCTKFACGQEFTVDSSNYHELADGTKFCPRAWHVLQSHVDAVLASGQSDECGLSLHDRAVIVSCPDGTRPVIFKVTPL